MSRFQEKTDDPKSTEVKGKDIRQVYRTDANMNPALHRFYGSPPWKVDITPKSNYISAGENDDDAHTREQTLELERPLPTRSVQMDLHRIPALP